jgi:hypothetical protein
MAGAVRICLWFKSLQSLQRLYLADQNGAKVERGVSIWFRGPQGPLIRVCGVSMDASFHGGSNGTIDGFVRRRRPEVPPFSHGGGHISPHLCYHMRLYTLTSICGGKGGAKKVRSAHGGGPLRPQ